jgi:hypothetical protein
MTGKVVRLLGLADGTVHGASGRFIVSYDPEYHLPDGTYDGGKLETTLDLAQATRFDFEDAIALWRSGPTCECHRLRPDGGPNCPLRAFNVEIA